MIDGQINIPDNIHLTGDTNAKIMLVSNFPLPTSDWPLITGSNVISNRQYKAGYNIEMSNITISSNRYNQNWPHDKTDETPTVSIRGRNLKFHDLRFEDGLGDFIKIPNYNELNPDVEINNNYFGRSGHCGVYVLYTGATRDNRVWVHDNNFAFVAANTGVRFDDCSGTLTENNVFTSNNQGDHAIYYTYKNSSNIGSTNNEVRFNTIYNVREYGILFTALVADGIIDKPKTTGNRIHHNLIYNTQWDGNGGGINVYGYDDVLIESNTIVGCEGDGISTKGYLIGSYQPVTSTTGFVITARNNIITGMKAVSGHGYGINNILSKQHTIISEYNNVYDNALGNYNGSNIVYSNNIHIDPQFVNLSVNNYHLATGSPCIDAGDPASNYSLEPAPNGDRKSVV